MRRNNRWIILFGHVSCSLELKYQEITRLCIRIPHLIPFGPCSAASLFACFPRHACRYLKCGHITMSLREREAESAPQIQSQSGGPAFSDDLTLRNVVHSARSKLQSLPPYDEESLTAAVSVRVEKLDNTVSSAIHCTLTDELFWLTQKHVFPSNSLL